MVTLRFILLLVLLSLAAPPLVAAEGVIGESYELELTDGTRLKNAVYRGKKDGGDAFELQSVVGVILIKDYRIVEPARRGALMLAASAQYLRPFNQQHLAFNEALAGTLTASIPVFATESAGWPRLSGHAGFTRLAGDKALLSGPEIGAGPGWLVPLNSRHHVFFHAIAGAGFYRLLNQNLGETFAQNTLILVAEAGYLLRLQKWGIALSYVQQYIHDEKLPVTAGGVRIGAVYFGGNA